MSDQKQVAWALQIEQRVLSFLEALRLPDQPGRFLPCAQGLKSGGRKATLGFSCFALKLYYMLGTWGTLDENVQTSWIAFLKSFQVKGKPWQHHTLRNAFIDPVVVAYLKQKLPRHTRLLHESVLLSKTLTPAHKTVIAETKQTIATLMQVGAFSEYPYLGFPQTPDDVEARISGLNWAKPWGAGGQASALAVFLSAEAPRILPQADVQALIATCSQQFKQLADRETGAYFSGDPPAYGELINGAMKVLTALDWLETPMHYPEQLIDTCLSRFPSSEGCHLVDAVYVLYRCLQYTQHRKGDVQKYCLRILDMLRKHHNADGGFSYFVGQSQKKYYGLPISEGLAISDIHGTILLTWALVMILDILQSNEKGWKVIKP